MTKSYCKPADFFTPLGTKISELVAHLDAGEYQLLVMLGEFDEKEEWAAAGIHSCAHWLRACSHYLNQAAGGHFFAWQGGTSVV